VLKRRIARLRRIVNYALATNMHNAPLFARLALWSSCLLAPSMAASQTMDLARFAPLQGASRQINVGLGAAGFPEFSGAAEQRVLTLPLIEAQWANGWFASTRNGLGFNFSRDPRFDFGLRVTADLGRDADRSPRLRGFDDIDPSAMLGAFANWHLGGGVSALGSLQSGAASEARAATAHLGLGWGLSPMPRLQLGATAGLMLASREYMQAFHGVTVTQSTRGGLPVYTPGSGLHSARLVLNANYVFDARWSVGGFVTGARLLGDAADSPITQHRNQTSAGLFVAYRLP
jgi:MipA family protein